MNTVKLESSEELTSDLEGLFNHCSPSILYTTSPGFEAFRILAGVLRLWLLVCYRRVRHKIHLALCIRFSECTQQHNAFVQNWTTCNCSDVNELNMKTFEGFICDICKKNPLRAFYGKIAYKKEYWKIFHVF